MTNKLFLDTSYTIALAIRTDTAHSKALSIFKELAVNQTRLVTTRPVLLEIGNALGKTRYRELTIQALERFELDPYLEIVPLTDDLYHRGFGLYKRRFDKEWGLVDCLSFITMEDHGITEALTSDRHFEQAGFTALLR